jgi:hypothetical protein
MCGAFNEWRVQNTEYASQPPAIAIILVIILRIRNHAEGLRTNAIGEIKVIFMSSHRPNQCSQRPENFHRRAPIMPLLPGRHVWPLEESYESCLK